MTKNKFLMVDLNEEKAKKVAEVIANKTCRKILDHLADKEAPEAELAKDLGLPLSTVHYNLQQLVKSGLVVSEHFNYSEKGKKVNHYKLANKYIIIAPKSTHGIKEKLKGLLPVGIISLGAAWLIHLYTKLQLQFPILTNNIHTITERTVMQEQTQEALPQAAQAVVAKTADASSPGIAASGAPVPEAYIEPETFADSIESDEAADTIIEPLNETINETIRTVTSQTAEYITPPYAWWFLAGCVTVIILYAIINSRRKSK